MLGNLACFYAFLNDFIFQKNSLKKCQPVWTKVVSENVLVNLQMATVVFSMEDLKHQFTLTITSQHNPYMAIKLGRKQKHCLRGL